MIPSFLLSPVIPTEPRNTKDECKKRINVNRRIPVIKTTTTTTTTTKTTATAAFLGFPHG